MAIKKSLETSKRFLELDALRGIAIITVLLFHYTTKYDESFGYSCEIFVRLSHAYGIHFFFILSGFVIYMSMVNKKYVKRFIVSRIARIVPVYWLSVMTTFFILFFFPLPGKSVTLGQAFINLTMFPHFFTTPRIDGVYWALYVEVAFYILMALVMYLHKNDQMDTICSVWLSIIFLRVLLEVTFDLKLPATGFLTLDHGQLFVAGIMFYRLFQNRKLVYPHIMIWLAVIAQFHVLGFEKAVTMTVCNLLFYLFISGKLAFVVLKPFLYLGSISYALFLLHQNIGYVVINRTQNLQYAPFSSIILASGITILLASIYTYGVEKPVAKFILKYSKK